MRLQKRRILLIVIVIFAAFLRLYKLGNVPSSMNADEVSIGYNAYSISKTGKDEYGKKFPLLFQSFDDYKLPVYIYLTVPSVAVFGLQDFSVRLPSAVVGTFTVLATYLLVEALFAGSGIALLSALFLAISPWHLQFSRSAYEANLAVFFAVVGIAWLLKGLKREAWYIPAFVALALSIWSYHSSRIFIPLMLLSFIILYFRNIIKSKRTFSIGLVIFVIICLPLFFLSISSTGLVRAKGVSALDDPFLAKRNALWRLEENIRHIPLSNIYHNQRLIAIPILIKGYLDHYNPNFFVSEIVQAKYHAPGIGLIYIWELPFLFYGLYVVFSKKEKGKWILLSWFFLAPVAAAPTHMLPHPVRTLIFLPSVQVIIAFGVSDIFLKLGTKNKIVRASFIALAIVIVVCSFSYYLLQYYIHLPIDYAKEWQYGHSEVTQTVKTMQNHFDKVVVSTSLDQPYIFFLYYLRYDPAKYLSYGGTKSGKFDEERNAFDIYEFHTFMKPTNIIDLKTLYVGTPSEVLPGAERLVKIKYPSGEDAYIISAGIFKKDWNEAGNLPYLDTDLLSN